MKYISVIFLLLLHGSVLARQLDSTKAAALSGKLAEYYETLKHESLPVQKQECDFLIETATDSLVRQFVAQDIYRHYRDSKIMGAENVAVHVYDKWFAPGAVKMRSKADLVEAKAYADFNRQSLIGQHAPALELDSYDGSRVSLFGPNDKKGSLRILYFYDTDCSKCRVETLALNEFLASGNYPVEVYAIYVGDDRRAWENYVRDRFTTEGIVHLWDPAFEADFQRKYGVTQTPRLLLVGPDGAILGRGLDSQALAVMIDDLLPSETLDYGTRDSELLFDGIFSMYSGRPSVGDVSRLADYIADKTLSAGDTLMFRQMAGDYLYYLSSHSGEGFKEGLRYHIDKNILSRDVWRSEDDSLKVVGFARIMSDLLSKALPGTKVPAVKVPGELYTWRSFKNVSKRLDRLCGEENIIIFYTQGCNVCDAEKAAAKALLARGLKVYMVNVDLLMAENPGFASRLMDAFDLSSLPFVLITDRKGTVLRRYVSLSS